MSLRVSGSAGTPSAGVSARQLSRLRNASLRPGGGPRSSHTERRRTNPKDSHIADLLCVINCHIGSFHTKKILKA